MNPHIKARDAILRIHDKTRQAESEWKGEELSEKTIGKSLHKLFKLVVK